MTTAATPDRHSRTITHTHARQVLDSRGRPTLEVDVRLQGGAMGRAIVPAGASTGRFEALELRDGDPAHYAGRGVSRAVANVNRVLGPALSGHDASDQHGLDATIITLDGTADKNRLGANALLGVSLAAAHAAAAAVGLPLYRYIGGMYGCELPVPMVNIISGGLHAGGTLDIQDCLVVPVAATSFSEALEMAVAVHGAADTILRERNGGRPVGLADEGGFGPALGSNRAALDIVVAAIERAGYRPGRDIALALDIAATHFYHDGLYYFAVENRRLTSGELADLLESWVDSYPILSIEDGMAEDDWDGWHLLSERLGRRAALVGDDLFTTNPQRLREGIARGVANAVLIKPNQIGTLSETLETVALAQEAGYLPVISARSGETEDATIADLAVGTRAGQIKIGSVARGERLAKYNQLARIEEELGAAGRYRGADLFRRFTTLTGDRTA